MGATYVIGDIHGCCDTLEALWPQLGFKAKKDRLWLVGDLINRGPRSLDVLRWAADKEKQLGDRFQAVLGNHDLHLLAVAEGYSKQRRKDTLDDILEAPDRDHLIEWLAQRPLVHREGDYLLVHAGLLPQWSPSDAMATSRKIGKVLADPKRRHQLLDRSLPAKSKRLGKLRDTLSILAGLRTCTREGVPCDWKGPPKGAPPECLPWFEIPDRASREVTVVFGHWAALRLHVAPSTIGLDDGCVWGHRLSAIRLEDRALFHQPALEA